jgi:hypothetical protein
VRDVDADKPTTTGAQTTPSSAVYIHIHNVQVALLKDLEEQLVRSLKALGDEEAVLREREVRTIIWPDVWLWD